MKKIFRLAIPCFFFICFATALAFAGNTYSISASCTIPAIPGVNAPLTAENTANANTSDAATTTENAELKEAGEPTAIIIEEVDEIVLAQNGHEFSQTLQTIYTR